MSWNHRVFKRIHRHKYLHEPETMYEIREVFYDKNGAISGISETPDVIAESLDDLKWTLNKMLKSCDKSIIDYESGEEL